MTDYEKVQPVSTGNVHVFNFYPLFPDADSGKPLEIQDAVQSYKMIMERNQSHSELLIEKSKSKRNQGSEALRKPRGTEKAELQLGSKNEEQQLDLIDVGYGCSHRSSVKEPSGQTREVLGKYLSAELPHGLLPCFSF